MKGREKGWVGLKISLIIDEASYEEGTELLIMSKNIKLG